MGRSLSGRNGDVFARNRFVFPAGSERQGDGQSVYSKMRGIEDEERIELTL